VSVGAKKSKWFMDSGCSKHMTGDEGLLTNYRPINGGNVVYETTPKAKLFALEMLLSKMHHA
ncbi:hypothetical protein PIB30_110057, partial [Stylosanthes scabra]|nr:hypothetical protein [Stylosanthes scabra]